MQPQQDRFAGKLLTPMDWQDQYSTYPDSTYLA